MQIIIILEVRSIKISIGITSLANVYVIQIKSQIFLFLSLDHNVIFFKYKSIIYRVKFEYKTKHYINRALFCVLPKKKQSTLY